MVIVLVANLEGIWMMENVHTESSPQGIYNVLLCCIFLHHLSQQAHSCHSLLDTFEIHCRAVVRRRHGQKPGLWQLHAHQHFRHLNARRVLFPSSQYCLKREQMIFLLSLPWLPSPWNDCRFHPEDCTSSFYPHKSHICSNVQWPETEYS